jgi:hypothetical protein
MFYYYNYQKGTFEKDENYSKLFKPFKNSNITNVLVTDINNDKEFDLIITFNGGQSKTEFYIFNPTTQVFDVSQYEIKDSGVIIGDLNGDS